MSGCVFKDVVRDVQCGAPIANYKVRMCAKHASANRGIAARTDGSLRRGGNSTNVEESERSVRGMLLPRGLKRWIDPPKTWRTTYCSSINSHQARACRYGHTCAYAHSDAQLRNIDDPVPTVVYYPKMGEPDDSPNLEEYHKEMMAAKQASLVANQPVMQDVSGHHPLWNVLAEDVDPEECSICFDLMSDRRLLPCGYMMCNKCMHNWRQTTISKNVSGTPCPSCRRTVLNSEVLRKGEKVNGAKGKVNVWANPNARAVIALQPVGSTLSLEEERAHEAAARERLRNEQAREVQEEANKAQMREQSSHKMDEGKSLRSVRSSEKKNGTSQHEQVAASKVELVATSKTERVEEPPQNEDTRRKEAQVRFALVQEQRRRDLESAAQAAVAKEKRRQAILDEQARLELEEILKEEAEEMSSKGPPPFLVASLPVVNTAPILSVTFNPSPRVMDADEAFRKKQMDMLMQFKQSSNQSRKPPGFEILAVPPASNSGEFSSASSSGIYPRPIAPPGMATGGYSDGQSFVLPQVLPNALAQTSAGLTTATLPTFASSEDLEPEETEEERIAKEEKKRQREASRYKRQEAQMKLGQKITVTTAFPPRTSKGGPDVANPFGLSASELYHAETEAMRAEQEASDHALAHKLSEQDRVPDAPPAPSQAGNWICPVCTYENKPLYPKCEMCMVLKE